MAGCSNGPAPQIPIFALYAREPRRFHGTMAEFCE